MVIPFLLFWILVILVWSLLLIKFLQVLYHHKIWLQSRELGLYLAEEQIKSSLIFVNKFMKLA